MTSARLFMARIPNGPVVPFEYSPSSGGDSGHWTFQGLDPRGTTVCLTHGHMGNWRCRIAIAAPQNVSTQRKDASMTGGGGSSMIALNGRFMLQKVYTYPPPKGPAQASMPVERRAPKWDTLNATPRTQSKGDNALNPVDAARLLPHSGRREGKNCKTLSE